MFFAVLLAVAKAEYRVCEYQGDVEQADKSYHVKGVVVFDPNVLVDPLFLIAPRARKRADELLALFQPFDRRNGSRGAKENIVVVKFVFPQPRILLAPYLPFLSEPTSSWEARSSNGRRLLCTFPNSGCAAR